MTTAAEDQWWEENFGTYDFDSDLVSGGKKDGWENPLDVRANANAARDQGVYADFLRQKYGIADQLGQFRDDILNLRRVASEGLDPNEFRRQKSLQTGAFSRQVTSQTSGALNKEVAGYGGALTSGRTEGIRAQGAAQKISGFGQILQALQSQDQQVRDQAKQALRNVMMAKQEMEQSLILQEEMIQSQLK